jgi:diguanylate cyclase (GGDEF)-like protein
MAISSLRNALFFLALNILVESLIITRLPKMQDNAFTFNTYILFYAVFFVIFYLTLWYEKKQKNKYRLLLKTYDGMKETKDSESSENSKLDITVLSEQGRKKYDITVTRKLNDKIFEILQKIKDIMHPFTIMYLEIDKSESKFFIKEVISESDHIDYNLEVGIDSGYLGWVVKNKRTLNVSNFDGVIHDVFYYTSDEMIKSLTIVPATDEGKMKGVLLADSRDFQFFSGKEENLLSLVSYQIMQEINNFRIVREIEYNARESSILNQLGKRLNASLDLNDTIQVMILSISNLIKSDLIAVIFLSEDETHCKVSAVHGEKYEHLVGSEFLKDEGIHSFVIEKKKKVLFKDFASVANKKNIFDNTLKLKDIETVFLLPLISGDIPFGAVLIANKSKMHLSGNTIKTIETLVNQSATSIANAKIYLRMEMMATTDGLTGLFNHRCFQDRVAEELERIKRYPENLSILLMDIDHFKRFNDTYGHPIGDKVLKMAADTFKRSLRKVDFAARYGGEEFVAILVNTDKRGAVKMGERIRKNIENEIITIDSKDMNITVSVGISTYPKDSSDKKGLIHLADKALYYAKGTGRNKCVHYRDISKEELI